MNSLKRLRKEKGFTQSQLSEKSGTGLKSLQHYEQGVRPIDNADIRVLFGVSQALDCRISDLIEDNELREKLEKEGY